MTFESELEQAWDFLEDGDIEGARRIILSLNDQEPGHPDVLLLQAACFREEGDPRAALPLLRQAAQTDPEWAVPEIWMAEILAEDPAQLAEALAHASTALENADEEDEFLQALAVKAGLELDLGKLKAARKTLSELPPLEAGAHIPVSVAREFAQLLLEAGDVSEASARFEALVAADPKDADSWHGIGLCAEEKGDEDAKRQAWLKVLALDSDAPLEDPLLSESQMVETAEAALRELPTRARELIQNVPILVADLPARDEVEKGLDPRLLGLFSGPSYSDPSTVGGPPQLTQIILFRKNLERASQDAEDLREQIRITLIHETGHFFGMSEDDLAEVGLD